MKRKYHTASGKNGSNRPPHEYHRDLLRQERDRLTFDVLRAVRGLSNKEAAGVACSPATIGAWRRRVEDGGTRYPRAITMNAVLHAHHKKLGVVDIDK